MKIMRRLMGEERGATMIMVAVSLVMIFAFAVIAVDMSLIQLGKTQLQNAADAAALGAALVYGSSGGDQAAATAEAIRVAGLNTAVQVDQDPVVITAADVTFPDVNQVRVETHRTIATGDPIRLFFREVLGAVNQGEVRAHAIASITSSATARCLAPWTFPDKWTELSDPPNDEFNPGVDLYTGTGFQVPDDVGSPFTLFYDNGQTGSIKTGWYQALDFGSGANCYRDAISGCVCDAQCCNDLEFEPGEAIPIGTEPGSMVGPTSQGLRDLIRQDPDAVYDPGSKTIINSDFGAGMSPRLVPVATYNPQLGYTGVNEVTIANIVVIFVEGFDNDGNVFGRFMEKYQPGGNPGGQPGFVQTVHLIE